MRALETPTRLASSARFLTTPSSSRHCHSATTSFVPRLLRRFVSRLRRWRRLGSWHLKLNRRVLWDTSPGSQLLLSDLLLCQTCRMTDSVETCLPTTQWYLYSEDDEPLGNVYRRALPEVGATIEGRPGFEAALVLSFSELRATCAMRRFRVVVQAR